MIGRFGDQLIGTDQWTLPVEDSETRKARFVHHETLRGPGVTQDLGDARSLKTLKFFFDETFCDPEAELAQITAAHRGRVPMELFFDLLSFEVETYVIEQLTITRKKTSQSGRLTRVEIEAELVDAGGAGLGGVVGVAVGLVRAIASPFLRS